MWPAFVMPSREYMISSRDSSIHWLSKKHFALRYMCMSRAFIVVAADAISLSKFFSVFQWILWYNYLKRILHFWWAEVNRCTEFNAFELSFICASSFYVDFKSQQKLVIKLSMDSSQKETNRQQNSDNVEPKWNWGKSIYETIGNFQANNAFRWH